VQDEFQYVKGEQAFKYT